MSDRTETTPLLGILRDLKAKAHCIAMVGNGDLVGLEALASEAVCHAMWRPMITAPKDGTWILAAWMGVQYPVPTRWTDGGEKLFPEIEGGYEPQSGWNPCDWMDDKDAPPNQSDCLCWLPMPEMPHDGNAMRHPIYRATLEALAGVPQ